MFDHPLFRKYRFDEIPLNRDLFLMGDIWLHEYEQALVKLFNGGEYENVGYIGYAAARNVSESSIELSWYPNAHTRFHEVRVSLPKEEFIVCVDCWQYDEKPHIFVKDAWLDHLYLRSHSVFVLIDAIGVKDALRGGLLTREKLIKLRTQVDAVAAQYPSISFISFADSLLLKSNWQAGTYNSNIKYNYKPETLIRLFSEIQTIYFATLGLNIYGIFAQGSNAFYDDPLLHISKTKNHISLNSLGLPFAQLMSIDKAVRTAIKNKTHAPSQLYMEKNFFHSLNFIFEFQKNSCGSGNYQEPLIGEDGSYFYSDCKKILDNLKPSKS